jgi:hypothetical protein
MPYSLQAMTTAPGKAVATDAGFELLNAGAKVSAAGQAVARTFSSRPRTTTKRL